MRDGLRGSTRSDDRHGVGIRRPVWGVLCALLVVAALGCAKARVTYLDADDKPVKLELGFFGRGCIAYETDAAGNPSLVLGQDGSTDWIGGRVISPIANLAGGIFTGRIGGITDTPAPSDIGGCDGIFTNQPTSGGGDGVVYELVPTGAPDVELPAP